MNNNLDAYKLNLVFILEENNNLLALCFVGCLVTTSLTFQKYFHHSDFEGITVKCTVLEIVRLINCALAWNEVEKQPLIYHSLIFNEFKY